MSQFDDTEDKITGLPSFGNAVDNSLGLDDFSEANALGEDFSAPVEAAQTLANEVKFNRWGQYANLPALPGEDRSKSWTRASTLKDVLTDKKGLELWQLRQTLIGIAMKPSLIAKLQAEIEAEEIDFDAKQTKDWLNHIAEEAKEVSKSNEGSKIGTAFHNAAEIYDGTNAFKIDDMMRDLDDQQSEMLSAYSKMLGRHKIRPVGHLMERVICVPELKIVGRLDRVYEDIDGVLRIGDLKSQKWEPGAFDSISLCVQLAIYANATWMLDEEKWEWVPFPKMIDKAKGIIAWVPGTRPGHADIYDLDLEWGWKLAKASFRVRDDWRKDKTRVTLRKAPPVPLHSLG